MTNSSSLAIQQCSVELRTIKYVKGYGFLSFARKYEKQLLDTGLDSLKRASKKVVHKTVELIGNKTADAVTNSYDDKIVNSKHVIDVNPGNIEEINIPQENREEILNELRKLL